MLGLVEPQPGGRSRLRAHAKFSRCGWPHGYPQAWCFALKSPAAMTEVPVSKISVIIFPQQKSLRVVARNDRQWTVHGLDPHGGGFQVLENGKRDLIMWGCVPHVDGPDPPDFGVRDTGLQFGLSDQNQVEVVVVYEGLLLVAGASQTVRIKKCYLQRPNPLLHWHLTV
jgi:hypothetical protein